MGVFDGFRHTRKERSARLAQRVAITLRVRLRVGAEGPMHSVLLEDLSTGGARISTPQRLPRGKHYLLMIDRDGEPSIAAPCTIVSERKRAGQLHVDYGLAFTDLAPAALEKLQRLVDKFRSFGADGTAFSTAHGR